ncbi:MAG: DUF6345 domain-containing protein [Terracidiphilus sp.]|jgi:hypothetical protein
MNFCTLPISNKVRHGSRAALILLGFACFLGLAFQPAHAQVNFPVNMIPKIPATLPTVKLTAQAPPEAFLRETLTKKGVDLKLIQPLSRSTLISAKTAPPQMVGVAEQNTLHAYWNQQTGEAEILPQLEKIKGIRFAGAGDTHLAQAVTLAQLTFARADFFPKDDTAFTVGAARPLVSTVAQLGGGTSQPSETQLLLTYVPVTRTVQGYKVFGSGSRAAIAVGPEGNIQGVVRRWKMGKLSTNLTERRTAAQIHDEIAKRLTPMTGTWDVSVQGVEIAYYDNGGEMMIPVIRATVKLHPHSSTGASAAVMASDDWLAIYLSYGGGSLPAELTPGAGPQPGAAPKQVASIEKAEVPEGDPIVGMYVVRDAPAASAGSGESSGFVAEANGFWNGLQSSITGIMFTKAQYYWAQPWMYTSSEASFVNNVNVALTEGHGNHWLFTTKDAGDDVVHIDQIPASQGYGAANHGKLDFWIIHSCDVVPSAADVSNWAGPWWNIFKGLHAVMGSRTEMMFDGGAVNTQVGQSIGNGAGVVPTWFNATMSYAQSQNSALDRPSAVMVCGHWGDTVFNPTPLPAATCLQNFWQPN